MKRATVIGGGIAGLVAAKVLADHFGRVIVYDGGKAQQALHLHVLLKSGQLILEDLFPGIRAKLVSAGCPEIDWSQDTVWENDQGAFPRYESSIKTLSMSRVLLQQLMMEDLRQNAKIEFISDVVEKMEELHSDLIVIAGGQNFNLKKFLGEVYAKEDLLKIDLTYRSYVFRGDDLNMEGASQYYYQMDPPLQRMGGVICPIENGQMMVTIIEKEASFSRCETLEDFRAKARSIGLGKFNDIIGEARPITAMATFRKTMTHRRRLGKIPQGIIVLGDVLTSLNPIFGQGMSLSLIQVGLLKEMLSRPLDEKRFHSQCHSLGSIPYLLSRIGSQESGMAKMVLRFYLRACQKRKCLHHLFLRQLHSLAYTGKLS